ncbi:hypothetical protein C6500_00880 [Candidatus Poribacteria bacterium]|nr:MAG: hypothetical protein C6500_00880 [Candidatus Poribacteria bacterium]
MKLKIANNRRSIIAKLGIGCVVCLLLGFGILLYAQDKAKVGFIATKPEINPVKKPGIDSSKTQAMIKMKEQAAAQANRARGRQNRGRIDFGENAAFYKVIIDNNLFRPLGWTPPNNEPAYSLIGTAVGAEGAVSQATLLEKRSNRYHFVTIGTKLGDMTVKDIQAKQVTLDNAGKPITLKAGELQFLTTSRGREESRAGQSSEGQSEKEGSSSAKNQANAKMEAEKRRQMEMKEQAAAWGMGPNELGEKLRNASPEERREIMQKMRAERAERAGRRGRGRNR